jgi:hypothetical protein
VAAAEIDSRSETGLDLKAMQDPEMVRSILNDGTEPPALEHNPADTLEEHADAQRERVQVPVSEAGAAAAGNHIDEADRPDAGADLEEGESGLYVPTKAEVLARINAAKNGEQLDLARSLVAQLADATDQAECNAAATKRFKAIGKGE